MKSITEVYTRKNDYPVKVLQFGEGNFLRAFADYLIDIMNEKGLFGGSVAVCQPIERGLCDMLNSQNGLYTLVLRGRENGEVNEQSRVIESVKYGINPYTDYAALLELAKSEDLKIIVSNTTEAGIAYTEADKFDDTPPATYPAKLTRFLFERFSFFSGSEKSGLLILPVELIEANGTNLKLCVKKYAALWNLGTDFSQWLDKYCIFANTLVDRIVTGYPKKDAESIYKKLGYSDKLLDTAEPFFFWAIEADERAKEIFPADKSGLNVIFSKDISGYKMRKVRILNGAHTVSVLAAFLSGCNIVREMMNDNCFLEFLNTTLDSEIIPQIPLPEAEKRAFADAVLERFNNPFIDHRLLDISLNSVSKFKARCLPSLLEANENGIFPKHLLFGLAALMCFYEGSFKASRYYGTRCGEEYEIRDDADILEFFDSVKDLPDRAEKIMSNTSLWGTDLTAVTGALTFTENCCDIIKASGVKAALELLK